MAEKVRLRLVDQMRAIERAIDAADHLYEGEFHRQHPHMVQFELDGLRAALKTLAFMQAHEQTIRDAISSARALDAAQDVP